jgi:hypothetical protein
MSMASAFAPRPRQFRSVPRRGVSGGGKVEGNLRQRISAFLTNLVSRLGLGSDGLGHKGSLGDLATLSAT